MKLKLFFVFLFISTCVFSQSEVYLYKDTTGNLTLEEIQTKPFQLLEEHVLEPYSDDVFWFKIPKYSTNINYNFKLLYSRIDSVNAYQNAKEFNKLTPRRFISYQFHRNSDVFIKVAPTLHSYIPFELNTVQEESRQNTKQLLFNGFYYGFAFLVVIYNIWYFFLFKDDAFLYYALFLISIGYAIFVMDGMLNFFNVDTKINTFLTILTYYAIAFFSSKFANNYLFLDRYYPKLKYFSYFVGAIIVVLGLLFFSFKNFYLLLVLNILVFLLLTIYWFCSVLLFKKNVYVKILTLAYVIILISGVDFYVLKFLGISFLNTNNTSIKIGAFSEMAILSFAVLYRMRTLKEENRLMRKEIVNYSKQLIHLESSQKEKENNAIDKLSHREREIFNLISKGKTNKEIATELNISVNTVKFHLKNIYEKLNIKNRKEALNY